MAEQGLEWSDDDCVFDKANDKRNNLPDIHLHDLRRTAATLMIEEQCPITAVAGTLGHAPPRHHDDHALQRASVKAANVMQNLFEKKEIS